MTIEQTDEVSPDKSRTSDQAPTELNMDDPADIQRGLFRKPSFFADMAISAVFDVFNGAVNTAQGYSGWTGSSAYKQKITDAQYSKLEKVARLISEKFPINYEAIRDFLIILCCIDKKADMLKIAEAVEIDSLFDESIVGNVNLILDLPDLYKVAFVANALDGILKLFSRFLRAQSNSSSGSGMTVDKLFGLLGGGSLGAGASMRLMAPDSQDVLGQFMSELLTGKRIPMTMIAKNPNLQVPSYIGQAFMGESPIALPNIDITQTFAKKIGCFPQPGNGSGSTSFPFQNSSTLSKSMSVEQLVGKVLFGSMSDSTQKKIAQVTDVVGKLNVLTGVKLGESIMPSKADTGIPLMSALSNIQSGLDKAVFSKEVFQEGWKLASAVSQHLAKNDPNYLKIYQTVT